MIIERIINNNVICSRDSKNREVVIMGRGVGFGTKANNPVDEERVEKIFRIDSQDVVDRFKELLEDMPIEHIQLSAEIISYARQNLNLKLNQNIYVTLTDHISFSIQRYKSGINLSNALLWDIKRFYKQEFLLGKYAIELINERLGIAMKEDEAGFIALHFVNAQYDTSTIDSIHITTIIQKAMEIVKDNFHTNFNEGSLHYERFVTHLKFLAQRIFRKEMLLDDSPELLQMVSEKYKEEYLCAEKITEYIEKEFGVKISEEEKFYLTIHIKRVQLSSGEVEEKEE